MQTSLKIGTKVKSVNLNCFQIITNVTETKVCYTPEIPTGGLKANKNNIKIFTTSVAKANSWIEAGNWIIQN